MSFPIEDTFSKISDQKYVVVHRQLWLAVMGGGAFVISAVFLFKEIIKYFHESIPFISLVYLIVLIISGCILLPFFVLGLITITTEIDFASRRVRITLRNIRGAQVISETPLDDIRISAVRMGGFNPGTLQGCWIVRAGFCFEDEEGKQREVCSDMVKGGG